MNKRCAFGLVSAVSALLAACHADQRIFNGYALVDLDGSNQAIIGNKGAVAVNNVTALSTAEPLIFVETGGDATSPPTGCSYWIIDTSKNSLVRLRRGTPPEQKAMAAIVTEKKDVVSRSCLSPG